MVPSLETGWGKNHFLIKFVPERNTYFLKDLIEGSGTFIKVTTRLLLKNKYIISFADFHIAFIFPPKDPAYYLTYYSLVRAIFIKFLEGPKANEILYSILFTIRQ